MRIVILQQSEHMQVRYPARSSSSSALAVLRLLDQYQSTNAICAMSIQSIQSLSLCSTSASGPTASCGNVLSSSLAKTQVACRRVSSSLCANHPTEQNERLSRFSSLQRPVKQHTPFSSVQRARSMCPKFKLPMLCSGGQQLSEMQRIAASAASVLFAML